MKSILLILFCIPFFASSQVTSYNTGQSFSCITVDSNYNIWAGTSTGVYLLSKAGNPGASQFLQVAGTGTFNIQALAADMNGNVWAGHNGLGGTTSGGGGIERIDINTTTPQHYSPDRNAECFTFFARNGVGTLSSAGLAVDTSGTVWSAQKYHQLTSGTDYILTPGTLSRKPAASASFYSKGTYEDYRTGADPAELPYPAYTCNPTPSQTAQSRNVYSVAVGKTEAWISVAAYTAKNGQSFPARLLKYNLDGTYTGVSYDFPSIGVPAGGIFNGVYVAPNGDVWVSMSAGKGFAVKRGATWTYLTSQKLPCILLSGSVINANAIWGNKLGQVFIGTNNGLMVYGGKGRVDTATSYTLYTNANNALISNQILGGASEKDSIQWIATGSGIMRSTLGKNYPVSIDSVSYTSCNEPALNAIEDILKQNVTGRQDYHVYKVETELCSQTGVNGSNCNAQFIYKLMKKNVALTAPTPYDFPYDNLSPILLRFADKDEVVQIIEQNVNAFDPATGTTNPQGGIKFISQVLNTSLALLNRASPNNAKIPFLTEYVDNDKRDYWMEQQRLVNLDSVSACATYRLYNSPYFINDRILYNITVDNTTECGDKLTSPLYDEVWIFPNDKELSITNYTKPGHLLSPGKVHRYLVEECGKVKVITIGTGLSYCGPSTYGRMNAIGNIIVGSILFKNIDLRLKKTFQTAH
jgi:hypothetical protein